MQTPAGLENEINSKHSHTHTPSQQLQHASSPITRSTMFVHFGDKPIRPYIREAKLTNKGIVGTQQTAMCSTISSITRPTLGQCGAREHSL